MEKLIYQETCWERVGPVSWRETSDASGALPEPDHTQLEAYCAARNAAIREYKEDDSSDLFPRLKLNPVQERAVAAVDSQWGDVARWYHLAASLETALVDG